MGVSVPTAMLILVFSSIGIASVKATHFRGGTISWKPVPPNNPNPEKITLKLDMSYKYDHGYVGGHEKCHATAKNYKTELLTRGYISCDGCGVDKTIDKMKWVCNDFSIVGDYAIGSYELDLILPVSSGSKKFLIYNQEKCWVQPVTPPGNTTCQWWKILTEVNLATRADNGFINSSPITFPVPIQTFAVGCQYILHIPVYDPDHDTTRCRVTDNSTGSDECPTPSRRDTNDGGRGDLVCGELARVTIYPNCTMEFNTHGQSEDYAIRLIIEDFDEQDNVLSKVSLSFLLYVDPGKTECGVPTVGVTPPVCRYAVVGETFTMDIVAESAHDNEITRIDTIKPYGMEQSSLKSGPSGSSQKYVTLTWTPTTDGRSSVRFGAVDSNGLQSAYENVFIEVVHTRPTFPRPTAIPEESFPEMGRTKMPNPGQKWVVKFDREIVRPTRPAYIKIVNRRTGEAVDSIDVSSETNAEFRKKAIRFTPKIPVDIDHVDATYSLNLEAGVAEATYMDCNVQSEPTYWIVGGAPSPPRPTDVVTIVPPTPVPEDPCVHDTAYFTPPSGVQNGDKCFLRVVEPEQPHVIVPVTVEEDNVHLKYQLCCTGACSFI